ncbi:MAG: hypothetical protein NT154_15100 [Verrucomicrobia bacterium]|nr:hypothetical protein [Verrucomicrobiota bacterium]
MKTRLSISLAVVLMACPALCQPIITIPWVIDSGNATNYSRTNLPSWWDGGTNFFNWSGGTNFERGVAPWMAWQAAAENWARQSNYTWAVSNALISLVGGNTLVTTVTNAWNGPTNCININGQYETKYDLNFTTMTPVAITGYTNKPTTNTAEVMLSVYNASSTNVTMTYPPGLVDGNWLLSQVISNGAVGVFWLRYTPVFPRSNVVFRGM